MARVGHAPRFLQQSLNWFMVSFALIRQHLRGIGVSALLLCLAILKKFWGGILGWVIALGIKLHCPQTAATYFLS